LKKYSKDCKSNNDLILVLNKDFAFMQLLQNVDKFASKVELSDKYYSIFAQSEHDLEMRIDLCEVDKFSICLKIKKIKVIL